MIFEFRIHGFHVLWQPIPRSSAILRPPRWESYNPPHAPHEEIRNPKFETSFEFEILDLEFICNLSFGICNFLVLRTRFGLCPFRSSLTKGICSISFPHLTEIFQFGWFPTPPKGGARPAYARRGFPIRTPPDHRFLATPRRLSRPRASFFGL